MGWVIKATLQLLYPQESDPLSIVQEARCAPEPVWTGAENLDPTRMQSPIRPARIKSLYRLRYSDPEGQKVTF